MTRKQVINNLDINLNIKGSKELNLLNELVNIYYYNDMNWNDFYKLQGYTYQELRLLRK